MKKIASSLLLIILLIHGCKNNSITNSSTNSVNSSSTIITSTISSTISTTIASTDIVIEKDKCTQLKDNGININPIEEVKNKELGTKVIVCGIITAWDYNNNFYIQDLDDGIYIYSGNLSVNIKHEDVGKTVKIEGTKDTYLDSHQVKLTELEVIDETYRRPEPIEIYDFTNLLEYKGNFVKLINVNIGSKINNVTTITDQVGNLVTRLYYGPVVQNKNNVDILGVIYSHTNRPNSIVISDVIDVSETNELSDLERINKINYILNIPEVINIDYKLPININGVELEWTSSNQFITIRNGIIKFNSQNSLEEVRITAYLFYKEYSLQKDFLVTIKNKELYQFPTNYSYDGPILPTDSLNKEFWEIGGGAIKVYFDSCHDGDTAKFTLDSSVYTTRFLGIDTEELYHPVVGQEEWGMPASVYTCNILKNANEIYLQSDPGNREFDDYNRLLAWIWVDGELLQYRLVSLGLAEVFYFEYNYYYSTDLLRTQNNAKNNNIGKWGDYLDPYWDYVSDRVKN